MNELDFLNEPAGSTGEPVSETPPEAAAPPADDGQPRDDKGRFATKEPDQPAAAAAPQPEPPQQAPADPPQDAPPPSGSTVPLSAFMGVKDELKEVKAELAKLREQPPAQPAPQPQRRFSPQNIDRIDPEEDAIGALGQAEQVGFLRLMDLSERVAIEKHGQESVDAAFNWAHARCDVDKAFNTQIQLSDNPFGLIMEAYEEQQLLGALKEPGKRARLMALLSDPAPADPQPAPQPAAVSAASPAPPPTPPPTPPRSIASAPSAGGLATVPTGPKESFEAIF